MPGPFPVRKLAPAAGPGTQYGKAGHGSAWQGSAWQAWQATIDRRN